MPRFVLVSLFAFLTTAFGCASGEISGFSSEENDECEECPEPADDDDVVDDDDDDDLECSFQVDTWDVASNSYGVTELANELWVSRSDWPSAGLVYAGSEVLMTRIDFKAAHEDCPDIEVHGFGMYLYHSDIAGTLWGSSLAALDTVWGEVNGEIIETVNGSNDYPNGWYPYLDGFLVPAGETVSVSFYADLSAATTNGDKVRLEMQTNNLFVHVAGVSAPLADDGTWGPQHELVIP